jgi:hypothetical protein
MKMEQSDGDRQRRNRRVQVHIREVLDSNLGSDTGYSYLSLS